MSHTDYFPRQLAYSINEMMSTLGISRGTLYDLINDGLLRTYKIGKRRFCTHEALLECQHKLESDNAA
ncbi:MAG: hypothetical protein B6D73_15220 [gamma proteobacterium symbiont of Stewartia floridana]|nr:MAG: hypothetical protein B6D73_15220 [gamma proteobacterium symbiont of Stewartia floridana]